jgi:gluconate 2-dehydrogenase alpha chain
LAPHGLSNSSGQVGKHFATHSFTGVNGVFPDRHLDRFSGTAAQNTAVADFDADNFDHSGLGFIGGSIMTAGMEAKPIEIARSTPPHVARWGTAWKDWLRRHANEIGTVTLEFEQLTYEQNHLDLDPTAVDELGMPRIRCTYDFGENERRALAYLQRRSSEWLEEAGAEETWPLPAKPAAVSTHSFGGTRMGNDPSSSVVDRWCMSHEVPNLAILGTSCFPTTGGMPPAETVQALAWRTAERIASNWGSFTA